MRPAANPRGAPSPPGRGDHRPAAPCCATCGRVPAWGRVIVYRFANRSLVHVLHGSLATVIVVPLSLEIVFVILLLGAHVIAALAASAAADSPWYQAAGSR